MNNKVDFPIYLVSLKQDIERRAKLKERFPETYPNFQYIEAVDGRMLSAKEYFRKAQGFFRAYNNIISPAELGCTLSHIKVLEEFLASEKEFCLILEDDVIGTDHDIAVIERTINMLSNKSSCLFFWGMFKTPYMRYQVGKKTGLNFYLVNRFSYKYLYGTFAYTVARDVAKDILSVHQNSIVRADDWGVLLLKSQASSVYFKNIIKHPDVMTNSHIESERQFIKVSLIKRLFSLSLFRSIFRRIFTEIIVGILIIIGNRRLK